MTTVLPFRAPSKPDAATTRTRVRNSPVYRDLQRVVEIANELAELAAQVADELPGTLVADLLTAEGRLTAQNLTTLANVAETFADLIDGDLPAL